MTGLGTMFTSGAAKVRIARAVLTAALRRLLRRPHSSVLVQNIDDLAMIERLGVDADRIDQVELAGSADVGHGFLGRGHHLPDDFVSLLGFFGGHGVPAGLQRQGPCRPDGSTDVTV